MIEIKALYYPGCASYDVLPDRLEQALRAEGVQAQVHHQIVTMEQGARLGMSGSPTVLIQGVDILEGTATGAT